MTMSAQSMRRCTRNGLQIVHYSAAEVKSAAMAYFISMPVQGLGLTYQENLLMHAHKHSTLSQLKTRLKRCGKRLLQRTPV